MNLRARGPSGQATLSGLDSSMTVAAFQQLLEEKCGVPAARQELLSGFPPRAVQLPADRDSALLASLPLADGDTLTVRCGEVPTEPAAAQPPSTAAAAAGDGGVDLGAGMDEDEALARAIAASLEDANGAAPPPASAPPPPPVSALTQQGAPLSMQLADGRAVARRVIDSDNSCLFNAVGYVMERSREKAPQLRRVIADAVRADPFTYNDAFLGKDPEEYCAWIQDAQKWGGAIELSILARHYGREVAAYDIQTQRCDVYGQDAGYSERVLLLYDGLHYDAMALAAYPGAPERLDTTIVQLGSAQEAAAMAGAKELVAAAHAARQFTDTGSFTLRCGVCQIGVKGEKEAVEHAKATGHQNFREYS